MPLPHPCRPGVEAIVFDMDGTVVESRDAAPVAYVTCVRELCGVEVTTDQVIALYPVGPPPALLSALLGRPAAETEVALYHEHLRRRVAELRHYPGMADTLAALAGQVPLGLFTGASTDGAEIFLGAAGLRRHFRVVLGSDAVPVKPAPDGILRVCRELGVAPERAAYVGDSPEDAGAARAAGVLAVAAGWGHLAGPGGRLDPRAALRDGLVDLVADSPADLLGLVAAAA